METDRNVPRWENMDKNILSNIFEKLDVLDVLMGASRVCITWFLASHIKTIWKTIKLHNLDSIVSDNQYGPYFQDNDREKRRYHLMQILIEINKFSRTVPIHFSSNIYCKIQEKEIAFISERMPNIRKLALPLKQIQSLNSLQSTFSKLKNLQTLITAQFQSRGDALSLELQVMRDNCRNLTNVKFVRKLDRDFASKVICYLPNLEKLSFRCNYVCREAAISLIVGLPNLKILNLSHSIFTQPHVDGTSDQISDMKPKKELVKIGTEKLDKFMVCCSDCPTCQDVWKHMNARPRWTLEIQRFWEKQWKIDEIKEFEL